MYIFSRFSCQVPSDRRLLFFTIHPHTLILVNTPRCILGMNIAKKITKQISIANYSLPELVKDGPQDLLCLRYRVDCKQRSPNAADSPSCFPVETSYYKFWNSLCKSRQGSRPTEQQWRIGISPPSTGFEPTVRKYDSVTFHHEQDRGGDDREALERNNSKERMRLLLGRGQSTRRPGGSAPYSSGIIFGIQYMSCVLSAKAVEAANRTCLYGVKPCVVRFGTCCFQCRRL